MTSLRSPKPRPTPFGVRGLVIAFLWAPPTTAGDGGACDRVPGAKKRKAVTSLRTPKPRPTPLECEDLSSLSFGPRPYGRRWACLRPGTRRKEKESGDKSPQSKAPPHTLWSARTCHRFPLAPSTRTGDGCACDRVPGAKKKKAVTSLRTPKPRPTPFGVRGLVIAFLWAPSHTAGDGGACDRVPGAKKRKAVTSLRTPKALAGLIWRRCRQPFFTLAKPVPNCENGDVPGRSLETVAGNGRWKRWAPRRRYSPSARLPRRRACRVGLDFSSMLTATVRPTSKQGAR